MKMHVHKYLIVVLMLVGLYFYFAYRMYDRSWIVVENDDFLTLDTNVILYDKPDDSIIDDVPKTDDVKLETGIHDVALSNINGSTTSDSADAQHNIVEGKYDSTAKPSIPVYFDLSKETKFQFFIGVFSAPMNWEKRNAVRSTWADHASLWKIGVVVRFFIGRSSSHNEINEALIIEQNDYHDIVRADAEEGYYNIAYKAAAIAQYAVNEITCDYVVKTDDDSYLRVGNLVHDILQLKSKGPFLWGCMTMNGVPHRNPKSQWYMSPTDYPEKTYPPFAHGPGYVYSIDIAKYINDQLKKKTLRIIKLEDVAMGIWVNDFEHETGNKVSYIQSKSVNIVGCSPHSVVSHYQDPAAMKCMRLKELKNQQGNICCSSSESFNKISTVETLSSNSTSYYKNVKKISVFHVHIMDGLIDGSSVTFNFSYDLPVNIQLQLVASNDVDVFDHFEIRPSPWAVLENTYFSSKWGRETYFNTPKLVIGSSYMIRYEALSSSVISLRLFASGANITSDKPLLHHERNVQSSEISLFKVHASLNTFTIDIRRR